MYKYLFGPVPSRRLGMSLGVDLIPHKVCTYNCVYCECGATTDHTATRREYVPVDEVMRELRDFMEKNPRPDYITFSGAGEPTLNIRFGEVLEFIKTHWPEVPVAVLTNGSLFFNEQVRRELLHADIILPSLDSALERSFRKIDRPVNEIILKEIISGLEQFRQEYHGQIWLEVFILPGYNDDEENLYALKLAFERIRPDRIQLNTLDRPGTKKGLSPAKMVELQAIADYWGLDNVEIIASPPKRKELLSYRSDMESAILETIARRPCTADDIAQILGTHVNEVNKYLGVLEEEGKIRRETGERGVFYKKR
ncbi:MAG: radical SAM protein [Bacteroidetes bacterium]|nr:radical SAM protein [Bacteroidota bacterium]